MKKLLAIMFAVLMIVSIAACTKPEKPVVPMTVVLPVAWLMSTEVPRTT